MKTWELLVISLLLMPILALAAEQSAPKPYVMWDDRHATIEETEDTVDQCFAINIIPEKDAKFNISERIQATCAILKISEREKREEEGGFIGRVFGLYQTPNENNHGRIKKASEGNDMKRFEFLLRELINKDQLDESNYSDLWEILKWKPTDLLKLFGYPDNFEYGAWIATQHKHIECTEDNNLQLIACGQVNKNRRLGILKTTIPLGRFTEAGTIYKYRNISQWAVKVGQEIVSADSCKPLVKEGWSILHFGSFQKTWVQCKVSRYNKCSYAKYENCDQLVVFTPNQTISKHLQGEAVVVAANTEARLISFGAILTSSFQKYDLVVKQKQEVHNMETSKHIFMVSTPEDYVVVNDVRIFGIASYSDFVFGIPGEPENLTVTNEDLDKLIALHGEVKEIMDHRKLLESNDSGDFIKYLLLSLLFIILTGVSAAAIVPYFLRENPRPAPVEPSVHFAAGQCEIIN